MTTPPEVQKLNERLARDLGRCLLAGNNSDGLFKWEWSEDLFWPAFKTGRMVTRKVPAALIGDKTIDFANPDISFLMPTPDPDVVYVDMVVPEYKRVHMSHKFKNQWVVTRWFPPEELPLWQHNFPHAPYPANGYRIHTNASLKPFCKPTLADTEHFIECIREQRSMTFEERLADMELEADREQEGKRKIIRDKIDDMIPAFGNYAPGQRGNFVSMPSLQKDLKLVNGK